MSAIVSKKKVIVHKVEIIKLEKHLQFELKLPANVKRITRILVTTTA